MRIVNIEASAVSLGLGGMLICTPVEFLGGLHDDEEPSA
jgi:hypothetical protein